MDNTQLTIGDRLRRHIALNRMSIKAFCELTGVPYRTLQDYLTGARKPGSDHLASLARVGVNLNWLLTGEDPTLGEVSEGLTEEASTFLSNIEIKNRLSDLIVELMDSYIEIREKEKASALGTKQFFRSFILLQNLIFEMAKEMSGTLSSLMKSGVGTELIVDVLRSAISKQLEQVFASPTALSNDEMRDLMARATMLPSLKV